MLKFFRAMYPRRGGDLTAFRLERLEREMSKISGQIDALKTTVTNVVAEVAALKNEAATDQDAADLTAINTQLAALLPATTTPPATEPPAEPMVPM